MKKIIAISSRSTFESKLAGSNSDASNFVSWLQQSDYIQKDKFEIYTLPEFSKNDNTKRSCDPKWTDLKCPCRGTKGTCRLIPPNEDDDTNCCWRFCFRRALIEAEAEDGFMLQLMEREKPWEGQPCLGNGQIIDLEMAEQVRIKTFQVYRPSLGNDSHYLEDTFNERDVTKVISEIKQWYKHREGHKNMAIGTIRLER